MSLSCSTYRHTLHEHVSSGHVGILIPEDDNKIFLGLWEKWLLLHLFLDPYLKVKLSMFDITLNHSVAVSLQLDHCEESNGSK